MREFECLFPLESFLIKIQLNVVPEDLKISNASSKTDMFYRGKCLLITQFESLFFNVEHNRASNAVT